MASTTPHLGKSPETTVAAIFVLLTGGFVGIAATYPPTDRLLPLVVGVPSFLLSVLILLSCFSTPVERAVTRFQFTAFDTEEEFSTDQPELRSNPYVQPVAWILLLFVSGILFGLAVAAPVYIYIFVTRYGGKSRTVAAAIGLVATALFVVLFEIVLGTPLYSGLITGIVLDTLSQ